jgi:hypothetical protein
LRRNGAGTGQKKDINESVKQPGRHVSRSILQKIFVRTIEKTEAPLSLPARFDEGPKRAKSSIAGHKQVGIPVVDSLAHVLHKGGL